MVYSSQKLIFCYSNCCIFCVLQVPTNMLSLNVGLKDFCQMTECGHLLPMISRLYPSIVFFDLAHKRTKRWFE